MKAAIYNPYWDSLGGGERYTISFAKVLLNHGYKVYIEWHDQKINTKLKNRFGIDTKNLEFVESVGRGEDYDLCFWVSDGSIPLMRARNNILHFQIPFTNVDGRSLINKMKLFRINHVVCNSQFTKKIIDEEFRIRSKIIHPPIDVNLFKSSKKENIILYVGRFSRLKQSKNQRFLVEAFKKIYDGGCGNWRLILAGGEGIGSGEFVEELKKLSQTYPISIITNPHITKLSYIYSKAKIFWSAAGYGESESKNPEKMEHFGMTIVESMSAKCVPVIYNGGGHKEIVTDETNGYLWDDEHSFIEKTKVLLSDSRLLNRMAIKAYEKAKEFSFDEFEKKVVQLV